MTIENILSSPTKRRANNLHRVEATILDDSLKTPMENNNEHSNPTSEIDKKSSRTTTRTMALLRLLSFLPLLNIVLITAIFLALSHFSYHDTELYWNNSCWWKVLVLIPLPYYIINSLSMIIPFENPFRPLRSRSETLRPFNNLYILSVTKGDNQEAIERSIYAHLPLQKAHPNVSFFMLMDEGFAFQNSGSDDGHILVCPKSFVSAKAKHKARALEWFRQTMKLTDKDWVLHLDEESIIDVDSLMACIDFISTEKDFMWGQGIILYNQHNYWKNWFFTVADALRPVDDLARFHLQYEYIHKSIFGAHGSFLLTNGEAENAITWELGSLTEDYEFSLRANALGYKCGFIKGFIREQSPMDLDGFMKQRRRWFVGIRRLPYFLPKIWAFLWAIGTLALYVNYAIYILGFMKLNEKNPLWLGVTVDLFFSVMLSMYMLGIIIQDIDYGKPFHLIVLHCIMVIPIQFITGPMESLAIIYALVLPPKSFDVIKK